MGESLTWQKSSFSGGGDGANCVEIAAREDGAILLRESDEPEAIVAASPAGFRALLGRVRAGQLDGFGG